MSVREGGKLPTGAVTLLLSDVEGSTRLWESGADVAAAVLARHYELLDAAIRGHGGVRPQEQGEGDSVVAAFSRPSDACAAALEIQLAFSGESWPEGGAIRVRIGLHTGEISLRDEANYSGPAIIRCARLRDVAHGGQTVLSSATRDLVVERTPDHVTLRDLGVHRLKDLGRAERVWQLCHPGLPDRFPPLRSLDAFPNNLPAQLTTLIGRAAALGEIGAVLDANRMVTLTGAGGCGKTRLALQAAADTTDRYPGGVWWIELASVRDPALVATAVAEAIGVREHDRPLLDTLVDQLRGEDTLVVLDNCEHVLEDATVVVEELLRRVPDLRVLATSREPFGLRGEVAWRVPSLDEPAAVALFLERATQARPSFSPDSEHIEVVTHICRRLDGLPLAIELAAARVRMMPPASIAAGLDDRFRLLAGGARTAMPRQQTLEASVAWSFDLLDERERVVLRRLSVFAGGFGLDAAERVVADDLVDEYAVFDVVAGLVDRSLVQLDEESVDVRYRLLETVRQYARERLLESGETDATRERHLAHYLSVAERAEPELARVSGPEWLARLERDHDNMRGALEWSATVGDQESFLRLATALTLFWELRGHLPEGDRWFDRALSAEGSPSSVRSRALWGAAHVALYNDDFETARTRASQALAMAERCSDDWTRARALNALGYAAALFAEPDARAILESSIELGRELNDQWVVADGLKMATIDCLLRDHYDEMRAIGAELEQVAEQLGNRFFTAWCHAITGYTAVKRGDLALARSELERSLEDCRAVGDPATGGLAQVWLASTAWATGCYAEAREQLVAFSARANASGGHLALGPAVLELAGLMLACDDPDARPFAEMLVPLFSAPYLFGWAQAVLGSACVATEDWRSAHAALDDARTIATTIENPWLLAKVEHELGLLACGDDELIGAEDLHHAALARCHRAGLLPGVVDALEALGALAIDTESPAEAARLLAAAATMRANLGLARWPIRQPAYDAHLAAAKAQLGAEDFSAAWEEGEALGIDEVIAYATRARGERKRPSSGWAGLTPTEERVVALVAEGLTNPQIGDRLFIARGTVKAHLAHIFAKLDVSTRAELATAATRRATERRGS